MGSQAPDLPRGCVLGAVPWDSSRWQHKPGLEGGTEWGGGGKLSGAGQESALAL